MASSNFSLPACASRESVRFISCSTLQGGGKQRSLLLDAGVLRGFRHPGLLPAVLFTFCIAALGQQLIKVTTRPTGMHCFSVQGHSKASTSLPTGMAGPGLNLLKQGVSGAVAPLLQGWMQPVKHCCFPLSEAPPGFCCEPCGKLCAGQPGLGLQGDTVQQTGGRSDISASATKHRFLSTPSIHNGTESDCHIHEVSPFPLQ